MSNENPVRWGVLGAAKFAKDFMARAIHAADGAELAGLATSSAEKANGFKSFAPNMQVFDTYDALLSDPTIDAVYVPLPNHLHVEWTLKALAAGKAVLTEKPIAMRASEFDQLIAARDASGRLAAEAYMIVHHPQWQMAKKLVKDGAIGKLRHVRGAFCYNNAGATANIRNRPETGGGALRDIGVYTMGSTRYVTDLEPTKVSAKIDWENDVDVLSLVQAEFSEFTMETMISMRMDNHQEMAFMGEDGCIRLTAPFNPTVFGEATLVLTSGGDTRTWRWSGVSHYVEQVQNFGSAMRGEIVYPCPLEFSRGTQVMIDLALESGRPD